MVHYDGRRFFNPTGANGQPFRKLPALIRTPRTPWPRSVPVTPQRPPALKTPDSISATFIGHSSFLIQSGLGNILIDPVYSERASPVQWAGPKRVRAPGIAFDALPEISLVLLSHNHYDHCDLRTLAAIERRFHPAFVTPLGNGALLRKAGARRVTELDWWSQTLEGSIIVTCTAAQHFSARSPFNRNRMLWGGFVIDLNGRSVFFAGDSGYGSFFRKTRERCGAPDLALIPIGAYEPRWFMKDIHMNPAEAVQAHLDLEARRSVAMHFGTFQLTPEAIDDPPRLLRDALRESRIPADRFLVPEVGETISVVD